jgi:hypothetical protein
VNLAFRCPHRSPLFLTENGIHLLTGLTKLRLGSRAEISEGAFVQNPMDQAQLLTSGQQYVTISPAVLFAPFISSLKERSSVASRASRAAFDARRENTNARMLKTNPATEATLPQFPARK